MFKSTASTHSQSVMFSVGVKRVFRGSEHSRFGKGSCHFAGIVTHPLWRWVTGRGSSLSGVGVDVGEKRFNTETGFVDEHIPWIWT